MNLNPTSIATNRRRLVTGVPTGQVEIVDRAEIAGAVDVPEAEAAEDGVVAEGAVVAEDAAVTVVATAARGASFSIQE